MIYKKILVTGEALFLERHQFLFQAMSTHINNLQFLPRSNEWYETQIPRITLKSILTLLTGSLRKANALFQKNKLAFILKSKRAEYEIHKMKSKPDLVFHLFGTYSPFWDKFDIPYVMYLDYTVALAERNWSEWANFINHQQRQSWLDCENLVYQRAKHIFCMSNIVKQSLIQDYELDSQKITVVGSSGDFIENYNGEKTLGTKRILFNGSDFKRKGGDLVLNAFQKVKQVIPEAKLVIIGKRISVNEDGVENPGHISRSDIHNLFLTTDLVVAPAFCDPFPTFLLEAMNYGIPCIVSANDGMPEIIEHEVNGIVIEQLTADMLASHIINLLSNPLRLESMSQAARSKVKTKFNWNNIAQQIVKTLSN
ncbi:glycosyltransferase family 4 protein [Iningainema sp. BLCCT55]|uniref:Glycosyltransferase family 4 protein n=2 Tax=Iningainema TaxID=1932705 RepID=A0A8J7BYM9_9CYAN|nr:glycosyltransferase family 4 protein [Iningainema tapete BLCC-T55]